MSYKFVKRLDGFRGDARLYKVTPPVNYGNNASTKFVVVSATIVPCSGPETFVFPSTKDGKVLDWFELAGSFQGGLDHEAALTIYK